MRTIAIVTLDGFNEIESFVASYMVGRAGHADWSVAIASPSAHVTSMNGVTVTAQMSLGELPTARYRRDRRGPRLPASAGCEESS
ncbi:MAG TPA: hypothetical protein VHX15_15965 [Frankiaceae bacterium]|jgi:hypothetical protein|nr:hypothetical protein [Frankiaceae bacterium]